MLKIWVKWAYSKTQQQIADELGISRSYVSRIETKVQNKLKNMLNGKNKINIVN